MVRAIEIRTMGNKQTAEAMRLQAVDDAVKQGYILTKYFYTSLLHLKRIRRGGMRTAYTDIIGGIDVKAQEKAADEVQFAQCNRAGTGTAFAPGRPAHAGYGGKAAGCGRS